jgi:hypothetical protein
MGELEPSILVIVGLCVVYFKIYVLQFYFSLLELLLVMPLNGGQLLSQTQNG